MSNKIKIVEVSPRDGLQNEKNFVPTEIKIALLEHLATTGLQTIEATSFVSPRWIPQLSDHEYVASHLPKNTQARFPILVPNKQGFQAAVHCKVDAIAVMSAASETFSLKNINRGIEESLQEFVDVIHQAKALSLHVRGYVSCVLGCPYEGPVPIKRVIEIATRLVDAGCDEISLGDTIGIGTPKTALEMLKAVSSEIPMSKLAIHFHDTYGQALANILACLALGIATIDSAVAGLGGCPYAKGASGNVATEDVIYMLHGMGYETGVDLDKLIHVGEFICHHLKRENRSKVAVAKLAKNS